MNIHTRGINAALYHFTFGHQGGYKKSLCFQGLLDFRFMDPRLWTWAWCQAVFAGPPGAADQGPAGAGGFLLGNGNSLGHARYRYKLHGEEGRIWKGRKQSKAIKTVCLKISCPTENHRRNRGLPGPPVLVNNRRLADDSAVVKAGGLSCAWGYQCPADRMEQSPMGGSHS